MAAAPKKPAPNAKANTAWVWITAIVIGGMCTWALWPKGGDSSTVVEKPAAADQQTVVDGLSRAAAVHGICYGWSLENTSAAVSVGSNLGVGVAVTSDTTRCPKYVEIEGNVYYASAVSEAEDYARWTVRSNIRGTQQVSTAALNRVGATEKRLLDDPAAAILIAAEALPLLAQEAGLATGPVPVPTPSGSAVPVAKAGSDFWRDRSTLLLVTIGFLIVAAGALVLGIVKGRSAPPMVVDPVVPLSQALKKATKAT